MKNSKAGTIAKLLRPARWVMDRLTYPRKFALVSLLFMLPLASVMYSLLSEFEERIQFSDKELQGIRYIRVLSQAQVEMGQAMHLAERHAMGDQAARALLVSKQGNVLDTLARLQVVEKELGSVLDTGTLFAVLKENHRFLQASLFGKETKDSVALHAQVLQDIGKLNAHVGDTSNLILDPELPTFYLMDISLNRVPYTTDLLIQARSLLSRVEGARRMTELDQAEIARLAGLLEDEATKIQSGLKVVYQKGSDARLQSTLSDAANYYDRSQKALVQALRGELAISADVARTASVLYGKVDESSVAATSLSERTTNALQDLLNVRVSALVVRERWIVASALVALALVLYLLSAFYASVMNIVTRLQAAALRMRSGDFQDTLTLQSDDELGQVATAFNKVAVQLREEKQQADIESERARKAEAELREQEAQLLASREEALAAARAKASFLATMSHEIRTPLNGVVGMTSLLADTSLTLEQQDYIHTMRVSSDQLLAVINDILDFSKIESGKLDLEHELVNLNSTVEEACDIAAPKAREKGLEILVDMDDGVPQWVLGDVTRLRQVLLNLINNAVKFTDKGQVIVSAAVLPDESSNPPNEAQLVEFRVKDTGIGIPLDQQGTLFQSFSQADTSTTRKYGGSGLGLAICKRLAELMGGTVGLQSTVGEGSSFWFTAKLQATKAPEDLGKQNLQLTSLVGKRILVVDDTTLNLSILDKQLKRWGMHVTLFERAPLALAWLSSHEVDVVLTDMHMPMMDGIEFAEQLRKVHFQAPILLLTSGTLPVGQDAVNFNARLFKPYRQSQLFNTLSSLLVKESETSLTHAGVATPIPAMSERILLVDDNAVNLKVALAMLKKLGYETDTGINGLEAIEWVDKSMKPGESAYACVLMDANMPVVDGYEATKRIIARWGAKAPPIFALTASVMEEDRQRSSEAGMIAFLSKPLRMDELGEAIRQYARKDQNPIVAADDVAQASTTATAPAAEKLIDWTRLEQFKEFDDEQMSMTHELIALFTADAPKRLLNIRQALDSVSTKDMSRAAHELRGAASNVGAAALAKSCQTLEELSHDDEWLGQAEPLVDSLQDLMRQTLLELANFTASL
jgi:signal transduction histidine kinase/DNA-binding response OmpR family regulator